MRARPICYDRRVMTTRATRSRAGRTREAILGLLRRRSGRSVGELARELGLAGATVRRHLDVLLRDGLVTAGQLRGRTGRPRYVFSLTGEGAERFGRRARLTRRLLREIAALRPGETAGRRGADLAGLVLARIGERIAAEYAPRVGGRGAAARARAAAALLADEGFEFEVSSDPAGGGPRLIGRDCPRRRLRRSLAGPAAAADGARCGDDRELLAALVGAPVETVREPERHGDGVCVYALRAR